MKFDCRMRLLMMPVLIGICSIPASAQQVDTRFSCSTARVEDGERINYADNGTIRLNGNRIDAFQWESALLHPPRSADCSVDESDGLQAESQGNTWRIIVPDGLAARIRRGYVFGNRTNCSIRIDHDGDTLHIKPACPALCGARLDFSTLSVDLKTGICRYDE